MAAKSIAYVVASTPIGFVTPRRCTINNGAPFDTVREMRCNALGQECFPQARG